MEGANAVSLPGAGYVLFRVSVHQKRALIK